MATRLKAAAEASVALGLTAGAGFLGMRLFLGSPLNPQDSTPVIGPVPVPPEIAAIVDDYEADLRYAFHCIKERWSYLEYRNEQLDGKLIAMLDREAHMEVELPNLYFDTEEAWDAYSVIDPLEDAFRDKLETLSFMLRDGHSTVVFKGDAQRAPYRYPFTLVEVAEGLMIAGVAEGASRIEVGDLLLDEWSLEPEVEFWGASSPAASRYWEIKRWPRSAWQSFREFRFERPGDRQYDVRLETVPSWEQIPNDYDEAPSRHHVMLEGDIGYFRPGDFSPPPDSGWSTAPPEDRDGILAEVYADFDRRLEELSESCALVLDLRGNPGGTDLLGQYLVDRLIDGDYVYFRLSSLRKSGWSEFHELGSSAPPGETELHVPLAVLIDERTFSTADNVVACLADVHPDVIFVGQPNGAGSGAPRGFELPRTGAKIYFCTQRVADPNGDLIEGHPQIPDFPVRPTRAQWLAGEDPALDVAVEALLGKL